MRILLLGGSGQLGSDLIRCNPGHEILSPTHAELDVTDAERIRQTIHALRPQLVINCAAFHNVPLCEERPEQAFRVNCIAMRDLAAACEMAGAVLITFSSDYVFGGEKRSPYAEDDLPLPVQVYGITRLAGEHAALAAAPTRAVIVRTCGLYGAAGARSKGGNFVDGRVADARAGKTIKMATDQTVGPTWTGDLAGAVHALAAHPALTAGIYHLTNEGECTWYELTKAIIKILGLPDNVVAVDLGGRSGAMRRPLYSVLANNRARALGITLPHWHDALERYLRGKYG